MMTKNTNLIWLFAFVLNACSAINETNGYTPSGVLIEKLRPGVHDRESVSSLLGSPTSISKFKAETWLYVSRSSERIAFFQEKIKEQSVLKVNFDDNGILRNFSRYHLQDGKKITLIKQKTPAKGKKLTIFQQLFGNIGRFSNREAE